MSSVSNGSKPAISTISIVQQRATLAVFLVVISAVVWWQNAGGRSNHPVKKVSMTPISNDVAELDFTSAEASWNSLRIDSQGNLKIDALTYSALVDAIALTQDKSSELPMARIALLLEKQFGATTSQEAMKLLPMLKSYHEVEQRWWDENGSRNPPAYEELFELQDELLGETLAAKMFSEYRRHAKMMLASHQIQNDTSLTQAQKDQAMMDLQLTFQEDAPVE